jgi:iron complex transport system ATP-binding protein
MIEVRNLSFQYSRETKVLDGISFSAEEGQFISLLGPNGAGKSTLMKCMLGLMRSYSGEILIDGINIRTLTPRALAKKIAYIPQSADSVFNYTVEEVVLMGTTPHASGILGPGKKEKAAAGEALQNLGIRKLQDRSFMNISGGERQLVLIARALAQKADILLMDEPTANLDYGNQVQVLEGVKKLVRNGYTIIQSTHNPDQAFLYSDQLMALNHGKIIAFGSPEEMITDRLIHELYGIDAVVETLYNGRIRVSIPKSVLREDEHEQ